MQVVLEGQTLNLNQGEVIGSGGEGTVFRKIIRGQDLAVKIYHHPDPQRARKLQAFQAHSWRLPTEKIALPLHVVYDRRSNNVVGLTMPYMGNGVEELASLANKKFRAQFLVSTETVADIFLDGGQTINKIHHNGLVIGDFNDQNALFRGKEMLFIDVDAWEFDSFCCPVGTEQFLAPELYGIDLSTSRVFKPEHDWYSYAVMLFRSLLYTHPYGGVHKTHKRLTARAQNRITVFDPSVTYPQIALSPDILDDDIAHTFEQIFKYGRRSRFPLEVLAQYRHSLIECTQCGISYPGSRKECPVCHKRTIVALLKPTHVAKGITVVDFLQTRGTIIYSRVTGGVLSVIANEQGKLVFYTRSPNATIHRKELFSEASGVKFELWGDILVVNPPQTSQLMLINVSGNTPRVVLQSDTSIFAGSRRAMYRTSDRYFFRITSGTLMYAEMKDGQIIERPLRGVMNNHTWFTVCQDDFSDKPTACGFFQVLNKQLFWLTWKGQSYDNLAIAEMEDDESLLDIMIKFSSQGVLIRRLTQKLGVSYIRSDIVDAQAKVVFSSPRIREQDHYASALHGQAYSTGILLHATDEGILREDIIGKTTQTFDATKGQVAQGHVLHIYERGVLIVKEMSVTHISLG